MKGEGQSTKAARNLDLLVTGPPGRIGATYVWIEGGLDVADPSGPSEFEIWERIIRPSGSMSKRAARRILELEFLEEDRGRMHELAERNRRDELSEEEEEELDDFCRVGTMLSTLKARARSVVEG